MTATLLRALRHWFAGGVCFVVACSAIAQNSPTNQPKLLLVRGADGEEEFGKQFVRWCEAWEKAARQGGVKVLKIGDGPEKAGTNDHDQLEQTLQKQPRDGSAELWLVLIGHGTFDGKEAKFNLRGPDFTATELAKWLEPFQRPIAVVNMSSASGPFINKLSAKNRVIITATRSGHEQNFAHLGEYLSAAIADPEADLDKDGQTSLLEAWLMASRRLDEFYRSDNRLATEHSLLDDNGDGLATPPDWFRGIRAIKSANRATAPDGLRAHQWHLVRGEPDQKLSPEQRTRRDELEIAISKLRESKAQLGEDEYYRKLEVLLVEMAKLDEAGKPANTETPQPSEK